MGRNLALFDTMDHRWYGARALMAAVVFIELDRVANVQLNRSEFASRLRVIALDKVIVRLFVPLFRAFPPDGAAIRLPVVDRNATFVKSATVSQGNATIDEITMRIFFHRNRIVEVIRAEAAVAQAFRIHLLTFLVLFALELAGRQLFHFFV
jgi:hypothetical protein